MSALNEYYAALERLKANKPIVLPKGSAINNDTVALEAGRKRGSIKKSRHAALIEAIELAAQQAGQNVLSPTQRIEQASRHIPRAMQVLPAGPMSGWTHVSLLA